jgi:hypothetical protein
MIVGHLRDEISRLSQLGDDAKAESLEGLLTPSCAP